MTMLALLVAVTTVTISAPWLVLIAGTIIPALTAAVTKDLTGWLQVALLAVLSAVGGVIAQATTGTFPLQSTLITIGVTALVAFVAHYGYNISGLLGRISKATFGRGIGFAHGVTAIPPQGGMPLRGTTFFDDPSPPQRR